MTQRGKKRMIPKYWGVGERKKRRASSIGDRI